MKGSALFALVLCLGVAVPFAKSGKPIGAAFRWSAGLLVIGGVLLGVGLALMSDEQWLNGAVNICVLIGVLPAAAGGLGVIVIAMVQGLRVIGFKPEEDQT